MVSTVNIIAGLRPLLSRNDPSTVENVISVRAPAPETMLSKVVAFSVPIAAISAGGGAKAVRAEDKTKKKVMPWSTGSLAVAIGLGEDSEVVEVALRELLPPPRAFKASWCLENEMLSLVESTVTCLALGVSKKASALLVVATAIRRAK